MRKLFLLLPLFLVAWLFALPAFADPVQAEHRVCERDADCTMIHTGCTCLCGGNANADAVNARYAPQYKYLEQCSEAEIHTCAEAGACALVKIPSAACRDRQCAVVWTPVTH